MRFRSRTAALICVAGTSGFVVIRFQREDTTYSACIAGAQTSEANQYEASPYELLQGRELHYFSRLQFERRRMSFLAGRLAGKRALAEYTGIEALTSIEIAIGVFGQPIVCLDRAGCADVSITHCGDYAIAVAFSPEHPLGIDVEQAGELVRAARRYIGSEEGGATERLKWGEALELATIWSAKEALSKVLKCGLTVPTEVLAVSNVEIAGPCSAVLWFKNFSQYKSYSTFSGDHVLSIVLPARSALTLESDVLMAIFQRWPAVLG